MALWLICAISLVVTFSSFAAENIEEVVVTGSLLPLDPAQITPVTAMDRASIEQSASFRIADFLQQVPQAARAPSSLATGGFSTLSGGLSTIDLRGLGANRTLVLLNGRRLVGGDPDNPGVANLNAIPDRLIKRVEVYAGGATAIYGSGAVAGVVNLLTDSDFNGFEVELQGGVSAEGGGEELALAFTGGGSFADGNGHVLFNLSWDRNAAIYSRDRKFSASNERYGDRAYFSQFTPRGTIISATGPKVPNENNFWIDDYDNWTHGFNQAEYRQLYIPLERLQWGFSNHYELNSNWRVYGDLSGSANDSSNQQEPNALILNNRPEPLPSSYPFFPQEILDTWLNNNQSLPAQIQYFRRLSELGPRSYEQERNSWRVLTGVQGSWDDWQTDLSYQWSRSDFHQIAAGHYNTQLLSQALAIEESPDVPDTYRCVSASARDLGCQPADLFAESGLAAGVVDFISAEQSNSAQLEIQEWQWTAQRSLFNWGAGDVEWLIGMDWRRESIESDVDSLTQAGLSSSVMLSPVNGRDEVRDVYTELQIPVLQQQLLNDLSMSFAYRLSDYDSIGSAHGWNAALMLSPVEQIEFYLRRSRAIRAPSIRELYLPPRGGFLNINDPCSAGIFAEGSTGRENCASLGVPADFLPTPQELAVAYRVEGNPDLTEEEGDTVTFGFAYRPWNDDVLLLRADYFDIQINDAVAIIDPMFKLYNCYSAENFPNNSFCRGLQRSDASQNFRFTQFVFGSENIASMNTQGVDVEFASSFSLGSGQLTTRLLLTYTDRLEEQANNRRLKKVGEPGTPRWKGHYRLNFSVDRWNAGLIANYHGKAVIENDPTHPYLIENNDLPSITTFDALASYSFGADRQAKNGKDRKIYVGIQNLTDKYPPYVPGDSRNGTPGTSTAAGVYDVRGRFLTAGIRYRF